MSTKEEDYSSWLAYESVAVYAATLLCGFTFTSITILITQLPNPSSFLSQVTLGFLAFMFHMFEFLLFHALFYLRHAVKAVPPEWEQRKGERRFAMWLWLLSFTVWGIALVLMFLLWSLTYLALASGLMYMLFTVLTGIFVWKPMLELIFKKS